MVAQIWCSNKASMAVTACFKRVSRSPVTNTYGRPDIPEGISFLFLNLHKWLVFNELELSGLTASL
jgi:hypothetical protein